MDRQFKISVEERSETAGHVRVVRGWVDKLRAAVPAGR
jgi:hypothetical protein